MLESYFYFMCFKFRDFEAYFTCNVFVMYVFCHTVICILFCWWRDVDTHIPFYIYIKQ